MTAGQEDSGGGHVFVCCYSGCKAVFKRKDRLEHHLNTHEGTAPHKCSHEGCTKRYTNPAGLKRHVKQCHQPQRYKRPHRCTQEGCTKVFKSGVSFVRHVERVHQGRAYKCSHCSKSFKKHQQLKIHEFGHTGVKPFKCTHTGCEKSFLLPSKLKAHQKCHRGYVCNLTGCEQKFEKWTLLRKHVKLEHAQVHKCSSCDKAFMTKSNLRIHAQTHSESRELFLCPYEGCPRFYFFEKNVKHHISSTHEGKKLACLHEGCNKEFKHKVTLKKHMRLHDPNAPLQPKKKRKCRKRRTMAAHLSGHKPTKGEELQILCKNIVGNSELKSKPVANEEAKMDVTVTLRHVDNESSSSQLTPSKDATTASGSNSSADDETSDTSLSSDAKVLLMTEEMGNKTDKKVLVENWLSCIK